MKVHELIEKLEALDPTLTVSVFTVGGDYGTPSVVHVQKGKRITRVMISAEEDE